MKYHPLSRRMFLQGAGTSFAIPVLGSLLPREARAQAATPVKRFISIINNYDFGHHAAWLPNAAGAFTNIPQPTRTFSPGGGHHDVRYQPLRDFAPTNASVLGPIAGASLSPYLGSTNILRGLNHTVRYGHGASWTLGGVPGDRTFFEGRGALPTLETADVVLNKNRAFNPNGLPLIFAGSQGYGPDAYSYTAVGGPAQNTACIGDNLSALYNRLFNNGNLPQTGAGTTRHPRYDLLTRVQEDYARVRNSRRISAADRTTLDNAVEQFRDAQAGLTRVSTAACQHGALGRTGNISQLAGNQAVGGVLADLIAASILCDSARVFTIGATFLEGMLDGQDGQHESVSHVPFSTFGGRPSWQITAQRQNAVVRNFVAPLLQRLSSAIDPSNGRSYLYNSLVYFTAESGIAHGSGSHPAFLFGNAGGALSSGNYVDYSNRARGAFGGGDGFSATPGAPTFSSNWWGVSYNRLLVTILRAMGLSPADYENHALNSQLYNRTDLGPACMNLSNLGGFGYALPQDITGENPASWGFNAYIRPGLDNQDLRQFRNPLPLPPSAP